MSKDDTPNDKRDEPDGYKDAETLRNMYWGDEMSTAEIGACFDISGSTVCRYMDDNGIERRPVSESTYSQWNRDHPNGYRNPDVLKEMYWDDEMSESSIAGHFGRTRGEVKQQMDRHGIDRRAKTAAKKIQREVEDSRPDLTEEVLRELYVDQRLSERAIAEMKGCSREVVATRLDWYGVERRSHSEAARVRNSREPPSFYTQANGYEVCETWYEGKSETVLIHRLAAVAWYGFDAICDNVVHHRSGHKRDNREGNLQPMSGEKHGRLHAEKRNSG